MSPLVVSQLLPLERCFDVVIFDEASQITPADAVGALVRADRAVVSGDAKQLPPTSFFVAATGGDDDVPQEEPEALSEAPALTAGLESVLDVMGALLPPPLGTRTLAWHYRSRDERLIAFSNAQPELYDWSLTTFPGVAGQDCLAHVLVNDAGDGADEVAAVVDLVLAHAAARPAESLGVIAMGIEHAERIAEAVRRAASGRTDLDAFFDEAAKEPFFVKNLERVQGDERDAIILSVGYGKTADGRLLHRFGPLNMQGGERRLNVAITRARSRMTVVSSFAASEIDPSRARAAGARMLQRYLAYAETRGASLGDAARPRPPLDPFEQDVHDGLAAAGLPVLARFGSSGAWIDDAASHPTEPGRMVLAVECDGATYRSSSTVRDRDRLRPRHLQRLGWAYARVWSSDWFHQRDAEIARVAAAYQAALAGDGAVAPAAPPAPAAPEVATVPGRGPRPRVQRGLPITEYRRSELVAIVRWIESDTLLRTEEELLDAVMDDLGFERKGPRIVAEITAAIADAR
jgi:hypothetical protein